MKYRIEVIFEPRGEITEEEVDIKCNEIKDLFLKSKHIKVQELQVLCNRCDCVCREIY